MLHSSFFKSSFALRRELELFKNIGEKKFGNFGSVLMEKYLCDFGRNRSYSMNKKINWKQAEL